MSQARLTVHKPGSHRITRDMLVDIPEPVSIGPRHRPVPHMELVDTLTRVIDANGFQIDREEFAVARKGAHLFGIFELDVKPGDANQDMGLQDFRRNGSSVAMGFRNATNQNLAIGVVGGERAWICDNLALSGDVLALHRKNTTGLDATLLRGLVQEAFVRVLDQVRQVRGNLAALGESPLTDDEARLTIYEMVAKNVLPLKWLPKVDAAYFRPAGDDVTPRSVLGLYGACTRVVREVPTASRRFVATTRIGRFFHVGATNS